MSKDNFRWKFDKILYYGKHSQINLWKKEYQDVNVAKETDSSDFLVVRQLKDEKRNQQQIDAMMQSIPMLLKLDHQNIVKFFPLPYEVKAVKLLQSSNLIYSEVGLEYCEEGDLRLVLNNHKNFGGIEQREAFNIMRDVSSAVFYLHEHGIVHGDIRPENVVLKKQGNKIVYKLIDISYLEYCAIKQVQSSDAYSQQHTINQYIRLNLCGQPPKRIDYLNLGILFNEILTGVARRIDQIQSWIHQIENDKSYPNIANRILLSKTLKWFKTLCSKDMVCNLLEAKSFLEEILSLKIVHVFLTPLHKKVIYFIDLDTNVGILKKKVAEQCQCDSQNLILYNNATKYILDDPDEKIDSQNEVPGALFVAVEILSARAGSLHAIQCKNGPSDSIMDWKSLLKNYHNFYQDCSREIALILRAECDSYDCSLLALEKRQDLIQDDIDDLVKILKLSQDQPRLSSQWRRNNVSPWVIPLHSQEGIENQRLKSNMIPMLNDSLKKIDRLNFELGNSILDFVTTNNRKETLEKLFEKCVSLHESFCVFQTQSHERYKTELEQLWTNLCENQQKFSESYNDLLKKVASLETKLLAIKKDAEFLRKEVQTQVLADTEEKIQSTDASEEKELVNSGKEADVSKPEEGIEGKNSAESCRPTEAVSQQPDFTETDSLVLESFVLQKKMEAQMKLMNKNIKGSSDL